VLLILETMNLKKSNREGTGKKHECKCCSILIPSYKIYCNRECYVNDKNITIECIGCLKKIQVPKNKKHRIYCSIQCSNKNINRVESHQKSQKTLINKYGVCNPFKVKGYANLNINLEKRLLKQKQTNFSKPPTEKQKTAKKISISLNNRSEMDKHLTKLKRENTNLLKFNDKSPLGRNSNVRYKADHHNKDKFINELNQWLLNNGLLLMDKYNGVKDNKGEIIYYNFKHIPSGTIFIDHIACGRMPIYKDPSSSIGTSIPEREIVKFIKDHTSTEIICNNRKIVKGFEIDIYLPELKLAIEFNGIKWHSELSGKKRNYHLHKTNECLKQNIHLIHIFEDEWKYKQDIIKSKLLNVINSTPTKIYARKCIILPVNNINKNIFLNQTHIQGEDKSSIKFGLYNNNELVSIITFGNLRKITGNNSQSGVYELIRFSSKLNTNVVGAFSKLLKHFIKIHTPTKIISYADRRYSLGKLYLNNGFTFIKNTPPNYWYMKNYNKREHRYSYRKSELSKKLDKYNPKISEWENMKNNKFDRIWDCGSKKYELIC